MSYGTVLGERGGGFNDAAGDLRTVVCDRAPGRLHQFVSGRCIHCGREERTHATRRPAEGLTYGTVLGEHKG